MAPSQDGIGGRSVERRLSSLGFSYHGRSGQPPGTAGSTGRHRDVSGAGNVDLPATMASYRPVDWGGWSGLERRRPTTLPARRSASTLTAASEAATVCSQRRATSSHQRWPRSHRSAPDLPIDRRSASVSRTIVALSRRSQGGASRLERHQSGAVTTRRRWTSRSRSAGTGHGRPEPAAGRRPCAGRPGHLGAWTVPVTGGAARRVVWPTSIRWPSGSRIAAELRATSRTPYSFPAWME
jgi:hypothetical protein